MTFIRPYISAFLWIDIVHRGWQAASCCIEIPQVFKARCAPFSRILVRFGSDSERLGGHFATIQTIFSAFSPSWSTFLIWVRSGPEATCFLLVLQCSSTTVEPALKGAVLTLYLMMVSLLPLAIDFYSIFWFSDFLRWCEMIWSQNDFLVRSGYGSWFTTIFWVSLMEHLLLRIVIKVNLIVDIFLSWMILMPFQVLTSLGLMKVLRLIMMTMMTMMILDRFSLHGRLLLMSLKMMMLALLWRVAQVAASAAAVPHLCRRITEIVRRRLRMVVEMGVVGIIW